MSTRSSIAMVVDGGAIDAVFCHWDGYPEYVGKLLDKNYATEKRVAKLMAFGAIDQLGKTFAKCRFYRRDLGDPEEFTRKETHKSLREAVDSMTAEMGWMEYLYLFADRRWLVCAAHGDGFYRLRDALEALKPYKVPNRLFTCHYSVFDDIMQESGLRPRKFTGPPSLLP